jgi:hypothetical protein
MYQPYPGGAQLPETQRPPAPASVRVLGGLAIPFAAPVKIFAFVAWLVGLAAVTFLWRGTATAFFKGPRS